VGIQLGGEQAAHLSYTVVGTSWRFSNHFPTRPLNHNGRSELLQKNTTLRQLKLSHNKLGDRSGSFFKEALYNNDTLHELDLSWNLFMKEGALAIADGIKVRVKAVCLVKDT